MIIRNSCPDCGSKKLKKNGHIHTGKQNHQCKACGRQFVAEFEQRIVSDDDRNRVRRLLAERISMRGICRVIGVGMRWLMGFAEACYEAAPEDLHAPVPERTNDVILRCLEAEVDELLSFVQKKANKQWLCPIEVLLPGRQGLIGSWAGRSPRPQVFRPDFRRSWLSWRPPKSSELGSALPGAHHACESCENFLLRKVVSMAMYPFAGGNN